MNEQEAFERLKQGDKAALEWTFRHTRDVCVNHYRSRYGMTKDDAYDLFTDSLMKMADNLVANPTKQLEAKLSSVVSTYAKFIRMAKMRDEERLKKKFQTYENFALRTSVEGEADEVDEYEAYLVHLEKQVAAMGDPCHALIRDRIWFNKPYEQIAREMLEKLDASSEKYKEILRKKIVALRSQFSHCISLLRNRF